MVIVRQEQGKRKEVERKVGETQERLGRLHSQREALA